MALLDEILKQLNGPDISKSTPSAPDEEKHVPKGSPGELPQVSDVPQEWVNSQLGPGAPMTPFYLPSATTLRGKVEETEPRTFQYVPNVNATISPRIAYGLMSFAQLKYYIENVPEVSMCKRLLTEEMKTLKPQVIGPDGVALEPGEVTDLDWMTTRPDGFTAWEVWLSRFLYNTMAYDAPALYKIHDDDGKITGLRIVDGSTLFVLIDERGEQPKAPAPAFTQIIYGQPRMWLSTDQLWYRPRNLRADAPYGITPVEDCLRSVDYLDKLWNYETAAYTEGTVPEMVFTAPKDWTPEQVMEFERTFNMRMAGSNNERRRIRFIPEGFVKLETKTQAWNKDGYVTALERVSLTFGIPMSEIGKAPGAGGLGGKGYQEKGETSLFRMGIGPIKAFCETPFNDVLKANGYKDYRFEISFGTEDIDNQRRHDQSVEEWSNGIVTRNEVRDELGLDVIEGPTGEAFMMPAGKADSSAQQAAQEGKEAQGANADTAGFAAPQDGEPEVEKPEVTAPETEETKKLLKINFPWFDLAKHCGVCEEDDDYFGAPVVEVVEAEFPRQGANHTHIVSMSPKGKEPRPALFKDKRDEQQPLVDAIGGDMYPREEAAYLVDRTMEMYLVPVSYVYEMGEAGIGAVVHYVRGNQPAQEVNKYDPKWVEMAAVLDYVIWQVDRKGHNWITHPDDPERPILIDNSMTFPVNPLRVGSAFVDAWRGKAISPRNLNALQLLERSNHLWKDLTECVGTDAVSQAKERVNKLLASGVIPQED